ncbi:MAG: phospholipase D-like domain-containing protein, partial [Rubrivivax sp.]|nr:phospholipase D-like domain-containing protein [Rubrivivax sp.]
MLAWLGRVGGVAAVAWLVYTLAGCSTLPTIVPDLRRAEPRMQMVGARGPLSAERSRAILKGLQERGGKTSIFDRHLALEEAIVGSPLTTGNSVLLLKDGPATYRAMLAAIEAARDHVNMETYIFEDDEVGQRFADALIDKQQQGVQVNLLRDAVGTLSTPAAFFERMTASGIQVLEFNPINPLAVRGQWTLNQRDHRKLLIVDGRTAFLGGINISSVYSGSSLKTLHRSHPDAAHEWRDTDLQLRGPVVAELQRLFFAAWTGQQGPAVAPRNYFPPPVVAGRQVVRAIGSTPEEPFSQIYATLLSAIGSAEVSVRLTN